MKFVNKKPLPTFWVTNVSDRNVTLSDLALNIPAFRTVNLMDTRHYSYTMTQLEQSFQSGSIFKKRNRIRRRLGPPGIVKSEMPIQRDAIIPSREKSVYEIKEDKYEELQVSNEEFAEENAELAELDSKPAFSKKV